MSDDTTNNGAATPQEPEGEAMGAVGKSRRPDPITGEPLSGEGAERSSNTAGDAYADPADKGISEESTKVPPGTPSSTPRKEPGLRDL